MTVSKESFGSGMAAWAKGLKKDWPDLANVFGRPREAGWKALEDLDLPRYERVVVSAAEFLGNPDAVADKIPSRRLFVFLQPTEGLPVRKTKLTREEAVAFVRETVAEHPEAWAVHVSETEDEVYGGNIDVRKDGRAIVEMTIHGQGGVSAMKVDPEIRAWQDPLTGLWKYNLEDSQVRQVIQDVMHAVPHEKREYLPGLYEFHVVQPEADGPLEVKFIDYHPIKT
ncbi:hypothetical protein HY630_02545 [Candidatus Uhrbacteria bacterium]|nr:hypothetical protein [Candidatus Uhrbacteria bacterium]